MGAWSTGIFDNDTAADWGHTLAERNDSAFIDETLTKVIDAGDEYLDADVGSEGLAACEVVARLLGKPGVSNSYTESVDGWVAKHRRPPSEALLRKAVASIDRISRAPSELLDLWEESDGDEFRAVISELRARLSNGGAQAPSTPWWKVW